MIGSFAVALVALIGCGGSDGGGTPSAAQAKEVCTKVCQKLSTCEGVTLDCGSYCSSNGSGGGSSAIPAGCNTNDTLDKVQACTNGTCEALQDCLTNATSACEDSASGGSGGRSSGGVSGNGSAGKSNGSAGAPSGDCTVCTKASACCVALAAQTGSDATACSEVSVDSCSAAGPNEALYISTCQSLLMSGAALNIAACK